MARLGVLVGPIVFVLWVYCVVDVITRRPEDVRHLPKVAWMVVVLLFPVVGSVAWLVAGRPTRDSYRAPTQQQRWEEHRREQERRRPRGPDDDPDFLKDI